MFLILKVFLFRYFRIKKQEGYRLAHTFFYDSTLICPPVLKLLGYRVIVSRRDMGYWYTNLNLVWLRANRFLVDKVIANSNAVKLLTMQKEGYKNLKVDVIYNGYPETFVESAYQMCNRVFDDGEFRVVLVANIRPIKRIQDAILAVKHAHQKIPNIKLYVIGDFNHSHLKELCIEHNIQSLVKFIGPRNDVLDLVSMCHVGILCSASEGFSNAIIEYMQTGIPVVCTDVGGNPEIVENGVNGFLYDVGDIQALSTYLVKLAEDHKLRIKMGQAGKRLVSEHYTLSKVVGSYQDLYTRVMSDA